MENIICIDESSIKSLQKKIIVIMNLVKDV